MKPYSVKNNFFFVCLRVLAFVFNIPVGENQNCQLFAQAGDITDEMLYLFCVNSSGISKRLVLIQAKICAWKRCLKS